MSMLAERRKKQKWSLNPRGKWWSEDSNKFGQRMLEKMGWTKGKGLGINEQGITEYLNVPYKKDTAGIGYDNNVDVWMEHQEKFNNFLQRLHKNENQNIIQKLEREDDSGQSMELKSKQSRARIHYKKFTRGKDINKYKPKDLANIFGQKELTNQFQIKTEKNDDVYEKKAISIGKNKNETVTINSGSMTDYFKHKPNYDKNFSSNMINNPATDSESENEQYAGFGFAPKTENTLSNGVPKDINEKNNYAFDNPCLGLNSPTEIMLSNTENTCKKSAKKRKKEYVSDSLHATEVDKHNSRKKLKTEIIDGDCKDGFTNPALNLDINLEEDCNGKEFEVSRAQFGLENCGLDLTDEKSDKKSVTFNDHVILYEYNVDSTKERKGKATLDKFEVENKKRKRKREQESITTPVSNGFVNEALDIETVCEEINDNKLNEHKSKKTKKRKISKISSLETIQESPEREKEIIEINIESEDVLDTSIVKNEETEIPDKKLKKKKKKKTEIEIITVIDNKSDELEIEEIIRDKKIKKSKEEEIVTSKKHKKEKKKNKENCKIEKCAIQTEVSSDQQNIEILDKTNSKQQQNYLIMDESKDAIGIETLPVIGIKKEEENAILEKKQKKKKKKSVDNEDCFRNECDIKEIFDKENVGKEQDSDAKKLEEKDKKRKKSKEKNVSEIEDSIDSNPEILNVNTIMQEKVENVESTHTPLKKSRIVESIDNIMHSPWSAKARMSKKMLINLFQNNALLDFPGSNIRDIKGYGVDIECSN
ncbi:protein IWS1 homolog A-like [Formica exsecta]|uniref:protein IWS1 homolog A-like n=1 Tax=Formica exsecta TaxID=72781 RepID=UPI0011414401|nr:protein IWS1 homolog A-like [Formica exsecta]